MKRKLQIALLAGALFVFGAKTSEAAFPVKDVKQQEVVVNSATSTNQEQSVAQQDEQQVEKQAISKKAMKGGGKSKIVAALLAFFLGNIGIHRFYMGQKKQGLMHIALFALGLILYIVGIASAVSSAASGTVSLPVLAIIGYVLILGNSIWSLVDLVRILMGSLEPEGGFAD